MAIENDLNTKEGQKFVESASVPNKPVVAVANPDGSDLIPGTGISTSSKYSTNAIDDYTTPSVTYICKEGASTADWYIMKIDETGNFPVFTHATVLNNPTKTTYALAYADRTTLTYNVYNLAF